MPRRWLSLALAAAGLVPASLGAQHAHPQERHFNPIIDLLAAGKPVFGLYAPSNPRPRPGAPAPAAPEATKSPADLARLALAYDRADYLFDGSMEGDFEAGYAGFSAFAKEFWAQGNVRDKRLRLPLVVKMNEIAPDPAAAATRIARQLDLGVSTVVFVGVESPAEVKQGLAAMRFASHGGTRPDAAGEAPQRWGMSNAEYHERADLWPLNPKGELVNWTIVESKAGLARVREIAAVQGIGVLFPGAGTLRGVFTTTGADGKRQFDAAGWEAAIQQVLAACKEFKVPCGYPAREDDIELRMKQGFSVFVIGWGEPGFRTIDIGRRLSGRDAASR